ncbi:unnamed protein product [Spodoptera exigua]|nr:unnamed protein product [Spodoptera exigua]
MFYDSENGLGYNYSCINCHNDSYYSYNFSNVDDFVCVLHGDDDLTTSIFKVFVYVMYIAVFVTALVGNGLVCTVVQTTARMKTVTNYFIVNLAPRLSKTAAKLVVFGVWSGALVTAAPIPIVSKLQRPSLWHQTCEVDICGELWSSTEQSRQYTYALLVLQFVLPLSALVCTYTRIAHTVWGGRPPGEAQDARDSRIQHSKRKVGNALVTPLLLRVSMGGADCLPSDGENDVDCRHSLRDELVAAQHFHNTQYVAMFEEEGLNQTVPKVKCLRRHTYVRSRDKHYNFNRKNVKIWENVWMFLHHISSALCSSKVKLESTYVLYEVLEICESLKELLRAGIETARVTLRGSQLPSHRANRAVMASQDCHASA